MNKGILFLILIICGMISQSIAQVNAASQADNAFFSSPLSNTGVAIAPNLGSFDYSVIVADEIGGNGHVIEVHQNPFGLIQPQFSNIGEDPDVTFGGNPDVFFVVAEDVSNDEIILTEYHLTTVPLEYNQVIQNSIDMNGVSYPNIDMNGQWEGVIVYEKSGGIYARSFSAGSIGPNPVFIAAGTQPDVAVHERLGEYTVTFINSSGNLDIVTAPYFPLSTGAPFTATPNTYSPPGGGGVMNAPRISTIHNRVISPTFAEYTVVVSTPSSGQIWGYFYDNFFTMYPNILINAPASGCMNDYPVVTYHWDRVSVAWASDYASCGVPGGTGTGVIKEELDFMGNTLTGQIFDEVNQAIGSFHRSKTAISAQYDGDYPVAAALFINESIVYHDGNDIYWKNRNVGMPTYKQGESAEGEQFEKSKEQHKFDNTDINKLFSFNNSLENKSLTFEMKGEHEKIVSVYNIQGQQIFNKEFSVNQNEFVLDYSIYQKGILVVHSVSNGIRSVYKIINH